MRNLRPPPLGDAGMSPPPTPLNVFRLVILPPPVCTFLRHGIHIHVYARVRTKGRQLREQKIKRKKNVCTYLGRLSDGRYGTSFPLTAVHEFRPAAQATKYVSK